MIKQFDILGKTINYREGTTDLNCIIEVCDRKEYQRKSLDIVFDERIKDQHWLDVGANIGAFTFLIESCGGYTTAFEPDEENYSMLQKNSKDKRSRLWNAALTTSEEDTIQFFKPTREMDRYRFTEIANGRPYMTLPNIFIGLLENQQFYGIKMDIEGSELGLIDSGLIPETNILIMEYHFSKDSNMKNFHRRMDKLRKRFSAVNYLPSLDRLDVNVPHKSFHDRKVFCIK